MVNSMVSNRRTMYLAIGFSGGYGGSVIARAALFRSKQSPRTSGDCSLALRASASVAKNALNDM
jgi:hypothetical protein